MRQQKTWITGFTVKLDNLCTWYCFTHTGIEQNRGCSTEPSSRAGRLKQLSLTPPSLSLLPTGYLHQSRCSFWAGIATVYGLDCQGIGGQIFHAWTHWLWGPIQPSIQLVPGQFLGLIGLVVELTIHPYLAPGLKRNMSIFALPLRLLGLF